MKVLVVASTFPASDSDATPAFVKDQVIALKQCYPDLEINVLAPHYRDETSDYKRRTHFDEYRFRYFFPRRFQQLAGRGIVPSIENNYALLLLVPFLFFFELVALLKLIRKLRPTVVYAHWFTPQGVNSAIAARLTGVPFVLTSHANDVRVWRKIPGIGSLVVRWLLPVAERITAVSASTYDKMKGFFSPGEWEELSSRVAIIPMGVDTSTFASPPLPEVSTLKGRYGYGRRRVILFLGRLVEKKGIQYLITAMAQLQDFNLKLVIAGDGPLRSSLEKQAAEQMTAGHIEFVGYLTGQKKIDYLNLADVVVVPSIETSSGEAEGFPVVVMEAMAAGKVCIASDLSGADAVISSGQNGFIVPQKDANALADRLQTVLRMDSDRLRGISESARHAVEALAWSKIAKRHYRFLFSARESRSFRLSEEIW